mgnify:CR=1 FL=1
MLASPVKPSFSASACVRSNAHRVLDDGGRLLRYQLEHSPVILRVGLGVVVKDGDGADRLSLDDQRTHQRRLELQVGQREPCSVELRARETVHQREPVLCDPAAQPAPEADRRVLEKLGMPSRRKTASKRPVALPDEDRRPGERNQSAQLRADQRQWCLRGSCSFPWHESIS